MKIRTLVIACAALLVLITSSPSYAQDKPFWKRAADAGKKLGTKTRDATKGAVDGVRGEKSANASDQDEQTQDAQPTKASTDKAEVPKDKKDSVEKNKYVEFEIGL